MEGQHRLPALEGQAEGYRSFQFRDERWTDAIDHRRGTLLHSVGGPSGVGRIVEGLLQRVENDRVLATAFAGVDRDRLVTEQVRLLADAFGGEHADALAPVARVRLTGEQFVRFVLHLAESFASLGLPQPVTDQLMLALAARSVADSCA